MKSLILILAVIFLSSAYAQSKIKIEVTHSGDDNVGNRLVYAIKEQIRKSSFIELDYLDEPKFILGIVSLDLNNEAQGYSSCYGYTLYFYSPDKLFGDHIFSGAGYCGTDRVDNAAQGIMANIDNQLDTIKKYLYKLASGE